MYVMFLCMQCNLFMQLTEQIRSVCLVLKRLVWLCPALNIESRHSKSRHWKPAFFIMPVFGRFSAGFCCENCRYRFAKSPPDIKKPETWNRCTLHSTSLCSGTSDTGSIVRDFFLFLSTKKTTHEMEIPTRHTRSVQYVCTSKISIKKIEMWNSL